MHRYRADVVIAGGGLAGIVTAWQLLEHGSSVLLIDQDRRERFGGLARESFGGVHLIGTPQQRRLGLRDSPELAWRDWESCAAWPTGGEHWPRQWARRYCERSLPWIYEFLHARGIRFLPAVNWPERGWERPGNSLPRWHVAWGTGHEIACRCIHALEEHPRAGGLQLLFEHEVTALVKQAGRVVGVTGRDLPEDSGFEARCEHVVIASGGIGGGDLETIRRHWPPDLAGPPAVLLNGAHRFGDGRLHRRVADAGGRLTHLDRHWLYAAGVHHPARRVPHDGLSLVPPRSALWFDALGRRIGPRPLVPYTDTRHLVKTILEQPGQYSWQVLNWKIAIRELAVSGCDYMEAFRHKKRLLLLKSLLLGNRALVRRLMAECPEDVVTAGSLEELTAKMNERSLGECRVDCERMRRDIEAYDQQIERGPAFFNDEQLRWLVQFRAYRPDRLRTCKFQKILDRRAFPLIAIREFILTRKSLGGIQTDLDSRVLDADGEPIAGLYAVGEAAGFGGGGIHGRGSLEGTFLGSCVLTARAAGRSIGTGSAT